MFANVHGLKMTGEPIKALCCRVKKHSKQIFIAHVRLGEHGAPVQWLGLGGKVCVSSELEGPSVSFHPSSSYWVLLGTGSAENQF